jgi:HK97 family phage major capsid protein
MPTEMIQKLKNEKLSRSFQFDRSKVNEEARTIDLAFSSEEPYERWFGLEILDHSKGSVDLSRLSDGGPLLMDHNTRDQIGVIENVQIDSDRVGRATVRFGKSARAEEIFQDVLDGIRQKVSVGYQVLDMALEKTGKKGEPDVYRITKWQPMEVSLVAIPADSTVGVGRSGGSLSVVNLEKEEKSMPPEIESNSNFVDVAQVQRETREAELQRVREISALGERFQVSELANSAIVSGITVEKFRDAILDKYEKPKVVAVPDNASDLGLDKKEIKRYSIVKAINAVITNDWSDAVFEREASLAVAKRLGTKPQGFFVPNDVLKRDLSVGVAADGGHLVSTDLLSGSFIELLRKKMVVMGMGSQMLSGLVGDVAIPRQTGGATAYWLAEAAEPTESQQSFDRVTMTPKTVGAFTEITRKLLQQSSLDVEAMVMADLAKTLALAIDLAAINGSGTSNQPRGILNTSGIGSVVGGTNGLAPTWAHIVGLESEVAADDADVGALNYLTNAKVRGKLKTTEKASSTAQYVFENGNTPINGYGCGISNQVPSNLTKGTSSGVCSAIIFGNFNDLLIGQWGALDLLVNPYANDKSGGVRITAFQDVDIAVRHPESFAAMLDALTT